MKKGWDKYATQKRLKSKGYLRKHKNGEVCGKATEASCSHSTKCCGQKQKEEVDEGFVPFLGITSEMLEWLLKEEEEKEKVNQLLGNSEQLPIDVKIDWYGKVVEINESLIFTGEENGESTIGVGKPIQDSREGCSEVGSIKPSSSSSRSRNQKVRRKKDGENGDSR